MTRLVLALALSALAAYAAYVAPALPGSPAAALAAACGLSVLLALLVAATLIASERARRRHSERRLAVLLQGAEQTDALITIVNRKGRIEYANRAVELTTGYAGRELTRKSDIRWLPWYADEPTADEMRKALLAGEPFRGTVACRRSDGTPFVLQDSVTPIREGRASARRFISTARDITELQRAGDRLAFLESYDPLTGLPNRGRFVELLSEALSRRPPAAENRVAVLVIDVDRFKYINDLLAPGLGDAALCRIAAVLRSLAGARGVACRLGGDEFAVALSFATLADVDAFAAALRGALGRASETDAEGLPPITVGTGIACSPEHGSDAATLLRNADLALAAAKASGRDAVQRFTRELSIQARERYSLHRRLAAGLRNGEYHVHYQPYCDLTSGRVSGAEALIRWDSGDLGAVAPVKFIPELEDSGLIVRVGEWVLRTACRQISDWQRSRRALPVAVNLSQLQLGQHDLVSMVRGAVKEHAIDPHQLTLELTESLCVRDIDFAIDLLRQLKEVGVSISVDDFGTGYSSLSYVKRLPVDNLKIDMSFVRDVTRDPDTASIITAITTMARSLGLKTIAEGVETAEQRNILRLLRCDMGQGYHFGPAVSADAFEQGLAS